MESRGRLVMSMRALAGFVLTEDSLPATMSQVAALAARTVPAAAGAGLSWAPGTRSATVQASHGFARRLDQLQYRLGEGPSLQAYDAQRVIAGPVSGRPTWPRFSAAALGEGVRAVLAAPLSAAGNKLGTLSLYSHSAEVFEGAAVTEAEIFATHAALVLACAQELAESRVVVRNLQRALASRGPIEQAKGIVMAREHYDPQQAFDVLRQTSQRSHVKLCDVARLVVESVSGRPDSIPNDGGHAPRSCGTSNARL